MSALTTQYLQLANQLLAQAQARPDEQVRLTRAAGVAHRLADLALEQDTVRSGYLPAAEDLITPALTDSISSSAVSGAEVYADMARTFRDQQRAQRAQGVGV